MCSAIEIDLTGKRADLMSLTGCRNLSTKDDVTCFRFDSETPI